MAKRRVSSVLLTFIGMFAFLAAPVSATTAYISNCCNHPSVVNIFETLGQHRIAQWTAGENSYGVVYSPDGTKAYVSNSNSQSISIIDTATGATLATVSTGFAEQALALSVDGTRLYASSYEFATSATSSPSTPPPAP